mmetsp:Transcript_62658/g.198405  ORF Transcript_62658/g.198405 Transcript_62658/m.198405 type:complete len:206 (-) Transcript_62658:653-1270(-)
MLHVGARGRARLDHVGVEGPLHQVLGGHPEVLGHLVAEVTEHSDELRADGLALRLGVRHAAELVQGAVHRVHHRHWEVQLLDEGLVHARPLVLAEKAVVHKHAVEAVTQGPVHQGRSHARVHAAGKRADNVVGGPDLSRHLGDLLVKHVLHAPRGLDLCDVEEEVLDRLEAAVGVADLQAGRVITATCAPHTAQDGDQGQRRSLR